MKIYSHSSTDSICRISEEWRLALERSHYHSKVSSHMFTTFFVLTLLAFSYFSNACSVAAIKMKPSLFGLGLLAPTACLAQVVETVWVGIGDCSSSGDLGGSGAGDSDDGSGTKIYAYTSTNPKSIVTTGIQTSMYPIVPAPQPLELQQCS